MSRYPCATPGCRHTVEILSARCSACGAKAEPDDTPWVEPKRKRKRKADKPWGSRDPILCNPSLGNGLDRNETGNTRTAL